MDGPPDRTTGSEAKSVRFGRRRVSGGRATGAVDSRFAMDGESGVDRDPGTEAGSGPMRQEAEFILWRDALGVSLCKDGT
jgi:hypothetical protein